MINKLRGNAVRTKILEFALACGILTVGCERKTSTSTPPYPPSPVVKRVHFDWDTHIRRAPGSDNWPVTWADDDNQYTAWGDGGGFGGTNRLGRSSIGIARIKGEWQQFEATNIWGGHEGLTAHERVGKSYGIVCIDGVLFMWVGILETKPRKDPFGQTKLWYSTNHGQSWEEAGWTFARKDGVMMPTVCNFGRDYAGSRDHYVYSYLIRFRSYKGPDDYEDKVDWLNCQRPGAIDLARVPRTKILERTSYEFFSGFDRNHRPIWTTDIRARKPVFENPAGVGWCANVSYNSGLKRYLLTTEHTETHRGNIGIFDAPEPWGPWTTVLYERGWGKGQIPVNTFFWNFSNRWASLDGRAFSLIFSGRKQNDSFNVIRGEFMVE